MVDTAQCFTRTFRNKPRPLGTTESKGHFLGRSQEYSQKKTAVVGRWVQQSNKKVSFGRGDKNIRKKPSRSLGTI